MLWEASQSQLHALYWWLYRSGIEICFENLRLLEAATLQRQTHMDVLQWRARDTITWALDQVNNLKHYTTGGD